MQTETLKYSLKTKVTVSELEETLDKPTHTQNRNMFESLRWVKDNTTLAITALESVSYLIKSSHSEQTIRRLFDVSFNLFKMETEDLLHVPLLLYRISNSTRPSECQRRSASCC